MIKIKYPLGFIVGAIFLFLLFEVSVGECQHKNIIEATCESDGTCERCKDSIVPALGHDYIVTNTVAPTCEHAGVNYFVCSRCGKKNSKTLNTIAHKGPETILQDPTPLYEGIKQIDCEMCGKIIKKTIAPLSLSPDYPIVITAAELLDAVESDIDNAKKLYEGKWLQLTGKVVSVTHNEVAKITQTYMGETRTSIIGEEQYTIDGVTIKSALIYWLAVDKRFERADIVVEMDTSLCRTSKSNYDYSYYPQKSIATVVAQCSSISEKDIVLTDGRYPSE